MSGNTNFSVIQNAVLVGASNLSAGVCAWNNGSGYVAATVANMGAGRATGIALSTASTQVPAFVLQTCGWLDAATSGLGAGAASWVRVNTTTAVLERCAPAGTDDVVGYCDVSGNVALIFGLFTAAIVNGGGGGYTPPTGTGIPHIVGGAQQVASSLIVDADVSGAAAIAASKVVQATGTGIPHVVAGALSAASSLIVNADVNPAAAIAGSKISPSFGLQVIETQTAVQFDAGGVATATSGFNRYPYNVSPIMRTLDSTATERNIWATAGDGHTLGNLQQDMTLFGNTWTAQSAGGLDINFTSGRNNKFLGPVIGDSTNNSPHSGNNGETSVAEGDTGRTETAANYSRHKVTYTGALTAGRVVTWPAPATGDAYYEKTLFNNTTGGFALTFSTGAGGTVAIAAGKTAVLGFSSANGVTRITADI